MVILYLISDHIGKSKIHVWVWSFVLLSLSLTLSAQDTASRAEFALQAGDYAEARDLLRQAWYEGEDEAGGAELSLELSQTFHKLGELDSAGFWLDRAWLLSQATDADTLRVQVLTFRGRLAFEADDLDGMVENFGETLAIYRRLGDRAGEGAALSNMAVAYHYQGDYFRAIEHLQQAMSIYRDIFPADHLHVGYSLSNIGDNYSSLSQYGKALGYYQKALAIKEKHLPPSHPSRLRNLNSLAVCNLELGHTTAARTLLEQSIRDGRELGKNHALAEAWHYLAEIDFVEGKPEASRRDMRRSDQIYLAVYGEQGYWLADNYFLTGQLYQEQQDLDSALYSYHRALQLLNPEFDDPDLLQVPESPIHDDLNFQVDLMLAKAEVLTGLYEPGSPDTKNLRAALYIYQRAFDLVDTLKTRFGTRDIRLFLGKSLHGTYLKAIALAWQLQQITGESRFAEEAFFLSEQSRAALLLQDMREVQFMRVESDASDMMSRQRQLRDTLARLEVVIARHRMEDDGGEIQALTMQHFVLQEAIDSLELQLNAGLFSLRNHSQQLPCLDLPMLMENMAGTSEALIEYLAADSVLYAFVVDADGLRMHRLPIRQASAAGVDAWLLSMQKREGSYVGMAHRLYRELIQPLDLEGKGITALYIVPDAQLNSLPFDALLTAMPQSDDPRSWPWLLRDFAIRYNFSARVSHHHEGEGCYNHGYLGFAPSAGAADLLPLAHNAEEISHVALHLDGRAFVGAEATRANFLASISQAGIIHIAAHTILDPREPANSRILFSAQSDPSLADPLYAFEINSLKINSDLIVLSACNTGTGKWEAGEGLMSMARRFAATGNPDLMMTLWSVPDVSASGIMEQYFYQLALGVGKARALQLAKLDYLNTVGRPGADPWFWAGFVQIGEGDSLSRPTFAEKYIWMLFLLLPVLGGILYLYFRKRQA